MGDAKPVSLSTKAAIGYLEVWWILLWEKISWKAAVFQLHLCDLVNSCLYSIFSSSLRSCQGISILAHQVLGVLSESKGTRSLSRGGKAGLLVTMQHNTP